MAQAISELGRQLLQLGDHELLDRPLNALGERVAGHETLGLFCALHESGEADSVRDALRDDRLARWVAQTCTAREEHVIAAQLRRWLGSSHAAAGPDHPARLVELESPPDDPEGLVAWARRHGVIGELMRPSDEVFGPDVLGASKRSLLELCDPNPARREHPAQLEMLRQRARGYLLSHAVHERALSAREALWTRALPAGPLRRLGERLRGLLPADAPRSLHALRFVSTRPVELNAASGVCRGWLQAERRSLELQLCLSGYEQRAVEGRCERCPARECVHIATLAARLYDTCLDPGDRLRASLDAFVQVPSWRHFIDALASEPPRERQRVSLRFVVHVAEPRCGVAVVRARASDALAASRSLGTRKLASPRRLLRSAQLSERDRGVLEALAGCGRARGAEFMSADLGVLRSLVDHPNVQREPGGEALCVREQRLRIELLQQPEGLLPTVTLDGERLAAPAQDGFVLREDRARHTLWFAPVPPALQRLLAALQHFRGVLPGESYPALAAHLAELRAVADVSLPQVLAGYEHPAPDTLLLRIRPLLEQGIELSLCVRVFPLSPLWPPGEGDELVQGVVDGVARHSRRRLAAERERARGLVEQLGLGQHSEIARNVYRVQSAAAALEVLSRAARLSDQLELEWAEHAGRLRVTQTIARADLRIRLFMRGAWLALEGGAGSGEAQLAIGRLLTAVRHGERFVQVQGLDYAEIEHSLFTLLQDAQLTVQTHDGGPALCLSGAPYLLQQLGPSVSGADASTCAWLERLAPAAASQLSEPLPLHDVLRGYQREGVQWLLKLASWAPGACLADEMGLGKTLQAIALLLQRAALGPALVIAPTSLLSNWHAELTRFAPQLQPLLYAGAQRQQLLERLGPSTVLIASYEILLRDGEQLAGCSFATQVVDEAQAIRNARTRRAQAVAAIDARFRLALTGTPIENRLGDLWSLCALIAPGLLGSWARFRARFAVPIERYADAARAARLRSLVEPFILRRVKDQVAPELPARIEVVHAVELSAPEQQLYDSALEQARSALSKRHSERAFAVHILAELTRLRQLACHPRLVLKDSRVESSKLRALLQLLQDILPRGHRVLLFSQFVSHLALVQEALQGAGIGTLTLDGSTPAAERAQRIERFQAGAAEVLLISLKAGGTGLNLTAADYVIHMDPWWNPAAEDQASDRAHRIGQTRPVTIVRLVAQGTIEERVLGLHEHKRRLASDILAGERTGELDLAGLVGLLDS